MKPIFVENSIVPKILSHFSPIEIWAITIFPFVFCQGELSERTVNHESIHFQQYLDLFIIGFLPLYLYDYLVGLVRYRKDLSGDDLHPEPYSSVGEKAYRRIRAEQEAYRYTYDEEYLVNRERFKWLNNRV